MFYEDTIAAIATASVNGGVSIIRISGENAVKVADSCLKLKNKTLAEVKSHTIHYGYVVDEEGQKIDEVLVLLMRTPNSYTREDVVEIQCHGGAFVCQTILDLILKKEGVRIAEPGEFTKRAFLNGRIDLSQAEAVMDLIESKSKYALESSVSQLSGIVKQKIQKIRNIIMDDVAYIEAALDDPEHISLDLFEKDFLNHITSSISELGKMKNNYDNGRLIYEGIQTAIIGKPNVGKSSFLNAMLGTERAIVTNVPGTTRDTLEENVRIGDVFLHLIDTAGIHETEDEVEKIGIKKSKEIANDADLVIAIFDSSKELTKEDIEILNIIKNKKSIVLLNKADLNSVLNENDERFKKITENVLKISALNGEGLEKLYALISKMFSLEEINVDNDVIITNLRHKNLISKAIENVKKAKKTVEENMPIDIIAIFIKDILEDLGNITGEIVTDDIINEIFSKFCLGK